MNITPINHSPNIDVTRKVSGVEKEEHAGIEITDQVQISSKGMEKAVEAAKSANVDRAEKVRELREKILNGTYEVDPEALAEKLLNIVALQDE